MMFYDVWVILNKNRNHDLKRDKKTERDKGLKL